MAIQKVVRPTLAQEVKRIWIAKLAQRGIAAKQAVKLFEFIPEILRMQSLLKATLKTNDEIVGEVRVAEASEGDRP